MSAAQVQDTTETGNTESGLASINEASFYTIQLTKSFVDNTQRELLDTSTGLVSIVKKMKTKKMVTPITKRKEMRLSALANSIKKSKTASFIDQSSPENQAILK